MNKWIVKFELVTQIGLLIMWGFWIILFNIFSVDEYGIRTEVILAIIITCIIYFYFFKILLSKIRATKKHLNFLVARNDMIAQLNSTDFTTMTLVILDMIYFLCFVIVIFALFCFLAIIAEPNNESTYTLSETILWYTLTNVVFLGVTFSIVDSITSIRKLFANKKLTMCNAICLAVASLPLLHLILIPFINLIT